MDSRSNAEHTQVEDVSEFIQEMAKALTAFRNVLVEWTPTIQHALSAMSNAASALLTAIQQMQLSSYSKEELDDLNSRYTAWGKYGWTLYPLTLDEEFQTVPETLQQADDLALSSYTEESISDLYEEILRCSNVLKDDFEEAYSEYSSGKYRVCALILFSLIERCLITTQSLDPSMRENRKVSGGGVKNFSRQLNSTHSANMFIYVWLLETNVLACLEAVYQSSPNFQHEPDLINRHFIEHGMSNRKTTKTECTKLFLLYYNILFLSEWIESQPPYSSQSKEV